MRTYGQYCPIARASEILAERWTPIIMRNLLNGATTFTQIADGAPGLSRSLLSSRLRELERAGVVMIEPSTNGHGRTYGPTEAGRDLHGVMASMASWGERWLELLIFDGDRSEVCQKHPGYEVELFVEAEARAFAEWHLGRVTWREALREGRINVSGTARLARELPTWNRLSAAARV